MSGLQGLMALIPVLASESGGEKPHSIETFLISHWLWTWILFGLVFLVLWKLAWKPLREQLEAREKRIRDTVDKADQVKSEAEALLDKHHELMDRAKSDAQEIIEEGRVAGERVRQDAADAGSEEAEEFIERARKEIDLETKKALDEIRREAVDLSLLAAGKILERSIEDEDHRKLADQVVDELSSLKRPSQ